MSDDNKKRFEFEYAALGKLAEHYSNLRSALTTFCLTASLAAFTAHFTAKTFRPFDFSFWAGVIMLLAGVFVCLEFSYRTEKAILKYKRLWRWMWQISKKEGQKIIQPDNPDSYPLDDEWPSKAEIKAKVREDGMNTVMVIGIIAISVAVVIFEVVNIFPCKNSSENLQRCCTDIAMQKNNRAISNISYKELTVTNVTVVQVTVTNSHIVDVDVTNCHIAYIPVTNAIITDQRITNAIISDTEIKNSATGTSSQSNRVYNVNVFGIQIIHGNQRSK